MYFARVSVSYIHAHICTSGSLSVVFRTGPIFAQDDWDCLVGIIELEAPGQKKNTILSFL